MAIESPMIGSYCANSELMVAFFAATNQLQSRSLFPFLHGSLIVVVILIDRSEKRNR